MQGLVKTVFLTIMCTAIAMLMYIVLFGNIGVAGTTGSSHGTNLGTVNSNGGEWMGVIWYAASATEGAMAKHYYEYSFKPVVHMNDSVDRDLGITVVSVNDTPCDLSTNDTVLSVNTATTYSTGWQ